MTGPADAVRLTAFVGLIAPCARFTLHPRPPAPWGTLDAFSIYQALFLLTAWPCSPSACTRRACPPAAASSRRWSSSPPWACLLASVSDS